MREPTNGAAHQDDRQMKSLNGLIHANATNLLPVFNDISQTTQPQTYEKGSCPEAARAHRAVAPTREGPQRSMHQSMV